MLAGQSSVKRAVICNGVHYESLSAAVRGVNIPLYKLHRVISGKIKIDGIKIVDYFPQAVIHTQRDMRIELKPENGVLLKYPHGENCIKRGFRRHCIKRRNNCTGTGLAFTSNFTFFWVNASLTFYRFTEYLTLFMPLI